MTAQRKKLALVGSMLAVLTAMAAWCLWPEPGPYYQGKSIAYWFHEYCLVAQGADYAHHTEDEVNAAIHQMGTNALPYLVKQALDTTEDSKIATWIYEQLDKLPDSWHLPPYLDHVQVRSMAVDAIDELKLSPADILPLVEPAFRSTNKLQRAQAVEILSNIETNQAALVPWFVRALQFKEDKTREMAVLWLGEQGPAAAAAVPALVEFLGGPASSNNYHLEAAGALGAIGPAAKPAVPMLSNLFAKEGDLEAKDTFAAAILRIDPTQTYALEHLIAALRDDSIGSLEQYLNSLSPAMKTNIPRRSVMIHTRAALAARALGAAGSNALGAVPALIEALDSTNRFTRRVAALSLHAIGAPRGMYEPKLEQIMVSETNILERFVLAHQLLEIDPDNQKAHEVIIDLIENSPILDLLTGQVQSNLFGHLPANPAWDRDLTPLDRAAKSNDPVLRKLAQDEIKRRATNSIKPGEAK